MTKPQIAPQHSLRVLIATGIFPPDIGGPASYVPAMAAELAQRGYRVTVVTLSDSVQHNDGRYPFAVIRVLRGAFKPLRLMRAVLALLRHGAGADVLFVNGLFCEAALANFLLRKPCVQKIVGDWAWERASNRRWTRDSFDEFQTGTHGLKIELLKVLRQFYARRADGIITPSRFLGETVSRWGVAPDKILVIYNAVEMHLPAPAPVPLSTPLKIVTVGRLVSWKGIDGLIEALCECPQAGLVIVGDGPERLRLENLIVDLKLSDRVYLAGQRSQQETWALMAACDLFVLNSTYEGFPHVVVEAMSAGLPVIATAAGGTPELVEDGVNGVLIDVKSRQALSRALKKLLALPDERRRLAAAAKRTVARFQASVMVEQTEAVLRSSAERGSITPELRKLLNSVTTLGSGVASSS